MQLTYYNHLNTYCMYLHSYLHSYLACVSHMRICMYLCISAIKLVVLVKLQFLDLRANVIMPATEGHQRTGHGKWCGIRNVVAGICCCCCLLLLLLLFVVSAGRRRDCGFSLGYMFICLGCLEGCVGSCVRLCRRSCAAVQAGKTVDCVEAV
jgi:hypothetical protein